MLHVLGYYITYSLYSLACMYLWILMFLPVIFVFQQLFPRSLLGYVVRRLVITIIIRRIWRWRNPSFSQRSENFKNVCAMFQKIIEYLTTIKRYSGRIFITFERDDGSFEILLCVRSIRVFTKFSGDPYYKSLVWFMIHDNYILLCIIVVLYISRCYSSSYPTMYW